VKSSIDNSSSLPAARPSRFRTSMGMTTRPALSMVVVMGRVYHSNTIFPGGRILEQALHQPPVQLDRRHQFRLRDPLFARMGDVDRSRAEQERLPPGGQSRYVGREF